MTDGGGEADAAIKRAIAAHFFVAYPFDSGPGLLTDHYIYLVMRLFGLTPVTVGELMLDIGLKNTPYGRRTHDPLLDWLRAGYERVSGRDTSNVPVYKSMAHEKFKAFSQTSQDGRSLVDIWNGASALCAVVSMAIAQHEAATSIDLQTGRNQDAASSRQRLMQGLVSLNAWVNAWRRHGSLMFDRDKPFEIDVASVSFAQAVFLDAVVFILFHELAHHFLGHLQGNGATTRSEEAWKREFEADTDAIRWLTKFSGRPWSLGPLVAFTAASLVSGDDDDLSTDSHPSLVERMEHYFREIHDSDHDPSGVDDWVRGYCIPKLRTIFANLYDRDRFPAWFGQTRDAWRASLQKKQVQHSSPLEHTRFEPNLPLHYFDLSRPRPAVRRREIDFI